MGHSVAGCVSGVETEVTPGRAPASGHVQVGRGDMAAGELPTADERDPEHAMDDDMVRLKSLLEEGKATARGETVTREELRVAASAGRRIGEPVRGPCGRRLGV